ncbi:hypothetical protein I553_10248 [Mycobacterium xenopi 4042]|uniref:Uncharacterized protein n=1 Tax=Mycobacterium xenopi 4042 TaxID=1299334 RepID=X8AL88_MYCXE|nr:hypothetical protein I553_10248 [Mycobacterium xenopi 4042]
MHLLDLFNAVLQHDDHGVFVAQPGKPGAGVSVVGGFHGKHDDVDAAGDLARIGVHRPGHDDRVRTVGAHFDLLARGAPAQQHRMAGGVQIRCDRRTDGTGTDNRNLCGDAQKLATAPAIYTGQSFPSIAEGVFVLRSHAAGALRAADAGRR